ncbi:MAG: hypothetical protein HOY71_44530 [Nonomuraea sp.]|nr:hypothetical protein [Nonomuraea sp.]
MRSRLVGMFAAVAAAGTTILAIPPTGASAAPVVASVQAAPVKAAATKSAKSKYLRTSLSFRCRSACWVRVRIKSTTRYYLTSVSLRARFYVNGHYMGTCRDWVGTLRPYRVKYAYCSLRTSKLRNYRDRWDSHDINRWNSEVRTVTYYRV